MNLPYQAAPIDRANRPNACTEACVDPALFGLSWDDLAGGIGSALNYLAPHAKNAAKDFAVSAINGL